MANYEKLTVDFFGWLKKYFPSDTAFVRTSDWAMRYGIPERHFQERLIKWAEEKLISLTAWDGMKERPWNEWCQARTVFQAGSDGGSVRVRLLADGGEFAERLSEEVVPDLPPPTKIGFTAP